MRCAPVSVCLVVLVLAAASPSARAQDGDGAEDAAPRGVESAEDWYRFSKAFGERLTAAGLVPESVDEKMACAMLHEDEIDPVADAALELVEYVAVQPMGLEPKVPEFGFIEHMVRVAVSRGGTGDPRLAYVIARLRAAEGDWDTAYAMLVEAREKEFDSTRVDPWIFRAAVNRAPRMIDSGAADNAIAMLTLVLEEQPDHPDVLEAKINLAAAYRKRDEHVAAERILLELTQSHPESPYPWNSLGRVYLDQGELAKSLEAYRKAVALAAGRPPYAEALGSVAYVLMEMGRIDECEQALNAYLRLNPDSPAGLHLLGKLYRERGESLEAVKVLRRAARLAPWDPAILTTLQQVHYERDEKQEAEEVGERLDRLRAAARRANEEAEKKKKAADAGAAPAPSDDGTPPAPVPAPPPDGE